MQIHTNILGVPLDEPRFEPFFAKLAGLGRTVWVHPVRTPQMPDYPGEPASRYGRKELLADTDAGLAPQVARQ